MREPHIEVFDIQLERMQKLYRFPNGLGVSVAGAWNSIEGPFDLSVLRYCERQFHGLDVEAPVQLQVFEDLSSSDVEFFLNYVETIDRGILIPSA